MATIATLSIYKKHSYKKAWVMMVMFSLVGQVGFGQALDDYRAVANGNWNANATWERHNGTTWQAVTGTAPLTIPNSGDGAINIQNGFTVTVSAAVTADQLTIEAGGQITINASQTLTIANGTGIDLTVNGTLVRTGTLTLGASATAAVNGTYRHNINNAALPIATWDPASTLNVTGVTANALTLNQAFGNIIWNCAAQTVTSQTTVAPFSVAGDFTITSTGVVTAGYSAGRMNLAAAALTMQTGKTFSVGTGASLYLSANANISGPTFTLASGGTLGIANSAGITASANTGNIRTTTRTFNTGANYIYNGTNQSTGNGLPATVNNLQFLTSGTKTLTAGVAVTNRITIATAVVVNQGAFNSSALELNLASQGAINGSWGSMPASSATNKSSLFFGASGAGILNITNSTCV